MSIFWETAHQRGILWLGIPKIWTGIVLDGFGQHRFSTAEICKTVGQPENDNLFILSLRARRNSKRWTPCPPFVAQAMRRDGIIFRLRYCAGAMEHHGLDFVPTGRQISAGSFASETKIWRIEGRKSKKPRYWAPLGRETAPHRLFWSNWASSTGIFQRVFRATFPDAQRDCSNMTCSLPTLVR
jgi:hypothetical protein